jgi:hypothetical protein
LHAFFARIFSANVFLSYVFVQTRAKHTRKNARKFIGKIDPVKICQEVINIILTLEHYLSDKIFLNFFHDKFNRWIEASSMKKT